LVLQPVALEDLSDVVSQPGRILATPELKDKVGYRTELTANSFSRGFQQSSNAKDHWHFCARFLSARLLATPKVLIRPLLHQRVCSVSAFPSLRAKSFAANLRE
jgi:hypothetical protein